MNNFHILIINMSMERKFYFKTTKYKFICFKGSYSCHKANFLSHTPFLNCWKICMCVHITLSNPLKPKCSNGNMFICKWDIFVLLKTPEIKVWRGCLVTFPRPQTNPMEHKTEHYSSGIKTQPLAFNKKNIRIIS